VALVNQIELEMPAKPLSVNAKIHPLLSELIMKALAKDPAERYQSSRELLEDLEQCKEAARKLPLPTLRASFGDECRVSSARAAASASSSLQAQAQPLLCRPIGLPSEQSFCGGCGRREWSRRFRAQMSVVGCALEPQLEHGCATHHDFEVNASETQAPRGPFYRRRRPNWNSPANAPRRRRSGHVGAAAASSGTRFSDLAEMPPLKNRVAPSVPSPLIRLRWCRSFPRSAENEDKARIQPREIAERAFQQIATVPHG